MSERASPAPAVVGLVMTGGTIGAGGRDSVLSVGEDPTRAEAGLLASAWPGPTEPHVLVKHPIRQLSENLVPEHWVRIADGIREIAAEGDVSGVLVLHGTDTMAYTAAALSFLLHDLAVPIVLTGSNLPSGEPGSDAERNVRASLIAMQELFPGTYVCFAGGADLPGHVHLGTHVRKMVASGRSFASINRDLVAEVEGDRMRYIDPYRPEKVERRFLTRIDERVMVLRLYPGLDFELAFQAAIDGRKRGVVIELYASATGPTETEDRFSVAKFIERCTAEGIVVVTTVAEAPRRNGRVYETTVAIEEAGGRFLPEMLLETATVKLMWALAQSEDPDEIRELMLQPIAGELVERRHR